jgi:hypothetical protein
MWNCWFEFVLNITYCTVFICLIILKIKKEQHLSHICNALERQGVTQKAENKSLVSLSGLLLILNSFMNSLLLCIESHVGCWYWLNLVRWYWHYIFGDKWIKFHGKYQNKCLVSYFVSCIYHDIATS